MKNFFCMICACSLLACSGIETSEKIDFKLEEKTQVKPKLKIDPDFNFTDVTKLYGLENITAYNLQSVDLNSDGLSDLVIFPSFYSEPIFYVFDKYQNKYLKTPSFFAKPVKGSYALFYDIDNDRILDAIVGTLNQKTEMTKEPIKIFKGSLNAKGRLSFSKLVQTLEASPNSTLGLIDYNLDGALDIFVGNWFEQTRGHTLAHEDVFYYQDKKNVFIKSTYKLKGELDKTDKVVQYINARPTYSSQICDIDQNGYPDILTTSTNGQSNKMWMNKYQVREKQRYFQDYALKSGFAGDPNGLINKNGNGRTFGVACADYNNDSIMDIFLGELTHNYDNEGHDRSSLLTGRSLKFPPRFYRTEYFLDEYDINWHQADRRGIWVDINNDGLLDLVVDNSGYPPHTKLIVFIQNPDHSFDNRAKELGLDFDNPMGTLTLDINRDGKMDLLTIRSGLRDESKTNKIVLLKNNIKNENKGLRIILRGDKSNTHGLNATVILKVKNISGEIESRRQVVSYSYGALPPQIEEGVHFGIAKGEKLLGVHVLWPYSKKLNALKNDLMKYYPISIDLNENMVLTFCESGNYLIGRRTCL